MTNTIQYAFLRDFFRTTFNCVNREPLSSPTGKWIACLSHWAGQWFAINAIKSRSKKIPQKCILNGIRHKY